MEQMPTVAQLPHLIPPFYTLQANTAHRRLAAARFQIFLLAAAAGEEFLILNYGDSVLDCCRDDVDRDRDERGGGAVEYEDVIVGTGAGVRRFFRRRLVEAEMCEGADEEVVGVRDYVEEESCGDDLGHFDGVEEETHFLDYVFQTAEGGGGGEGGRRRESAAKIYDGGLNRSRFLQFIVLGETLNFSLFFYLFRTIINKALSCV